MKDLGRAGHILNMRITGQAKDAVVSISWEKYWQGIAQISHGWYQTAFSTSSALKESWKGSLPLYYAILEWLQIVPNPWACESLIFTISATAPELYMQMDKCANSNFNLNRDIRLQSSQYKSIFTALGQRGSKSPWLQWFSYSRQCGYLEVS